MQYEPIEPLSVEQAEMALLSEDLRSASRAVVSIGLHCEDLVAAVEFLLKAAISSDPGIKGNALLSFGHVARRFRELPHNEVIRELVAQGLRDDDPYVRGHAHDAADDLEHFLGWDFRMRHDA